MHRAPGIRLDRVSLSLDGCRILECLDARFDASRWHSILGRSGSGKTSLLRVIAGLQCPDSGRVETGIAGAARTDIAYMAQDDGLLPWLNVRQNIQLGPWLRGEALRRSAQRVNHLLQQVGLDHRPDSLPATLSGGMRQRVALARTLLEERPIVLMDEPFSRLDSITRDDLQTLASTLLRDRTVILVTHDPVEALRLSHELHVLEPGSPTRLHSRSLVSAPPRALDAVEVISQLPHVWHRLRESGSSAGLPA